jgi:hypothetical protein
MDQRADSIRDRLLSRLPQPAGLADYRKEIASMLEKNETRLRREKWGVSALWFFVVALSTVSLFLGGQRLDTPKGPWFGTLACFWLLFGAVELLKHFINRSRVDLLKEVKQVQLQVLELHDLLRKGGVQ